MALRHIGNTLVLLYEEIAKQDVFVKGTDILERPFTGVRWTVVAGYLSLLEAWPQDLPKGDFGESINSFCRNNLNLLTIWSEGAVPFFLSLYWHLRRHDPTPKADFLLRDLIVYMVRKNHPESTSAIANPYYQTPDILPHFFGFTEEKIADTFKGRSYSLESLVHLFVRRNWKQAMRWLWPEISRIKFISFDVDSPQDFFIWRSPRGITRSISPKPTKIWGELVAEATESEGAAIPDIARTYPHFVLLYLMVCPHRSNSSVVRWLDLKFGA